MQKRRLGESDIFVSVLGLGTVKFGRNEAVKYPKHFALPSDQDIHSLLALCEEAGINLLDTAPAYGTSEVRLGQILKNNRHQWVISTKVGEYFENATSYYDFSAASVCASVDASLKRLQTDYIDVLLVHSNGEDSKIIIEDEIFVTLSHLKAAGKIRSYGMSTKTVQGGMLCIQQADLAMVTLNPEALADLEIIQAAERLKKGIFIKKAFGSGHLSPQACMPFVLQHKGVTSVIVGSINPIHLRENIRMVECHPE